MVVASRAADYLTVAGNSQLGATPYTDLFQQHKEEGREQEGDGPIDSVWYRNRDRYVERCGFEAATSEAMVTLVNRSEWQRRGLGSSTTA
jgi:hypothetical protein